MRTHRKLQGKGIAILEHVIMGHEHVCECVRMGVCVWAWVCGCRNVCLCLFSYVPNNVKSTDSASAWTSWRSSSLVFWQIPRPPLDLEENDLWHTAKIRAAAMANGPLQPALHRCQRGLTPLLEKLSSAPIKQGHNSVLYRVFHLKGAWGAFTPKYKLSWAQSPQGQNAAPASQQPARTQPVSSELHSDSGTVARMHSARNNEWDLLFQCHPFFPRATRDLFHLLFTLLPEPPVPSHSGASPTQSCIPAQSHNGPQKPQTQCQQCYILKFDPVDQGLANHGPWAKSRLLPVLLVPSHSHLWTVCGCSSGLKEIACRVFCFGFCCFKFWRYKTGTRRLFQ